MTPEQIREVASALADAEAFFRRVTRAEIPAHMAYRGISEGYEYTREDDDAWRAIRRARASIGKETPRPPFLNPYGSSGRRRSGDER